MSVQRLTSLLRRRTFSGGLVLDVIGFGCASVAVRSLPLFLVQAVTCSSVGVTALLASRLLQERLRPSDRAAIAGIVVGLTLLVAAASPGPAHVASLTSQIAIVFGFPAASAMVWGIDRYRRLPAAALGALSGASFGVAAVTARILNLPTQPWKALVSPLVWSAVAFTLLGLLLLVVGLDRGSATAVSAASMAAETLLPAGVAILLLGDGARPGWSPIAVAGFALSTLCAVTLSRNTGHSRSQPTPVTTHSHH